MTVIAVHFIDAGRRLTFKTTDGSIEVYDFGLNLKWHFGEGENDVVTSGIRQDTLC